jgi:gamma-glutamyl-gamma-aminobutyrate hydrolase PuuD
VRPRIGIAAYAITARFGAWEMPTALVPGGYVEGVRLAGGTPILLPQTPEGVDDPADVIEGLDGLVLTGGVDIGPSLYDAERHPETQATEELRDAFEAALARAAHEQDLPVLGICRGMQLLNVLAGGTLHQHLADVVELEPHRPGPGVFGVHEVTLEPGSKSAEMLGERVDVQSTHHQGIDRLGSGLVVTGRSEDGLIEALEDPSASFCVGVQWHPEEEPGTGGAPLFVGLVEAARARRAAEAAS